MGTWIGKPGTATFTTLTLYQDHTYKQVYEDPDIDFTYESEGRPKWYVEYRESGSHLLHLEKMLDCDNELSSCMNKQDTQPEPILWGDPCEGGLLEQKNEVILVITGVWENYPEKFPKDILLWYLSPDPDTNPKIFQLKGG